MSQSGRKSLSSTRSLSASPPHGEPVFGDLEKSVIQGAASGSGACVDEDTEEYDWLQGQLGEALAGVCQDGDEGDMGEAMMELESSMTQTGEHESLLELLDQSSSNSNLVVDLNAPGPDGDCAIHLAALYGHMECAKLLIEGGADADTVNPEDGSTPLQDAAAGGYLDMMKLLHAKAPDIPALHSHVSEGVAEGVANVSSYTSGTLLPVGVALESRSGSLSICSRVTGSHPCS
eukprot:gene27297-4599_t